MKLWHMGSHTKEEAILDAFLRTQLKQILNVKYPVKIANKSLY